MERISKNFSMDEFARSLKADAAGVSNDIPQHVKPAIRALVKELLQPLCTTMGWRDYISSGYRSFEVNRLVGGAAGSQHLRGEAADNVFYKEASFGKVNIAPVNVLRTVVNIGLDFDQMIAYPTFVHLSYTKERPNRRQILYDKKYTGPRL